MGNLCGREYKRRRKKNLIKSNGAFCYYCKRQLAYNRKKQHQSNYATLDHRIPKSKSKGWELPNNKILACRECNELKKDMMPEEFLALLAEKDQRTRDSGTP